MDRLQAMALVLAVVEEGSLSAAGRKLVMPLPTVSRRLSDLESHLKARLFNRSTRRLTLTESGRIYVEACKRIIAEVGEAERTASGEFTAPQGELVIGAPVVFGRLHVLPVICEFLRSHPLIDVRLVLGDRNINLLEDHIDLAVRIGALADSRLVATRVGATRRVVCGSPAYLAANGTPKHPNELASHACIAFQGLTSTESWVFKQDHSDVSVPIRPRLIVNTAEAAIDAAKADVGLTRVLSYQIETATQSKLLVTTLMRFAPAPVPINLLYAVQKRLPLKLRAFVDFATEALRRRLQRNP
jgi:DNA-binding transcriptional LysR family regulator